MICKISAKEFKELDSTKYDTLYYIGNLSLLKKRKIAIVGTRRPSSYTKTFTYRLANELSKRDIAIVSGTAMGVDIVAHRGAMAHNTIAVVANGVDIKNPKINSKDIQNIQDEGLVISTYPEGFSAKPYTFVQRNEIISLFCDALIVSECDLKSGSLHTAKFATKHKKPIFVLPQRLGDSLGTLSLVKEGRATVIEDIDLFVDKITNSKKEQNLDEILEFCKQNPSYEEAVKKYANKIYEYEIMKKIKIVNGVVHLG